MGTIGIIAGGGKFPFLVAENAIEQGETVCAVGFSGNTDPLLAEVVDSYQQVKIGQLGKVVSFFRKHDVDRVVMAGTINKAGAMDIMPDLRGAKVLLTLRSRGDDALLRAVVGEMEKCGMKVVGPHEIVPDLLTPAGVLSKKKPNGKIKRDIEFGLQMVREVGRLDIGQTIVVKRGVVAAVEALEGTNEAIKRGAKLAGKGAVVVKAIKPGQEKRADMPALGLQTIEVLKENNIACLAVEAGKTLFFDRQEALSMADSAGIIIVGLTE